MKLIKSIQLFFQEGNSDKVYEIELLESGADAYVVNFRYGRRGGTLKDGTKTVFPVTLAEAEKLFAELENEKRKKGYAAEGENANFIPEYKPLKPEKSGSARHKTVVKLLKAALNDDEHESWPLSRIIWRAGELAIPEAVPQILKLADKKDHLQLYSCIWALSRIGDAAAVLFLNEVLQEKHPAYILNLAKAALLNISDELTRAAELKKLGQSFPESFRATHESNLGSVNAMGRNLSIDSESDASAYFIKVSKLSSSGNALISEELRQAIAKTEAFLNAYALELCTKGGAGELLIPFYLISTKDELMRAALLPALRQVPVKPGHFKYVRQIFKISEMLNDTVVYGILSKVIEKAPFNFTSSHLYIDRKWVSASEELKKENSTLAFSKKTKEYFSRRILRTLRRLGNDQPELYTSYATDILLTFDDELDQPKVEKTSNTVYDYNSTTRNYIVTTKTTWYDTYSGYGALYYILYANSPRYTVRKKQTRWECVPPYEPGKPFEPLREEAFALLWNKAPGEIIRLLAQSRCERVTDFALFVFQNNAAFKEQITEAHLFAFIRSRSIKVQQLGFDLVKETYKDKAPGAMIISALLLSQLDEARTFAQQFIDKEPARYANDADLITGIILSANFASQQWLQAFLLQHKPQAETQQTVFKNLLEAIHAHVLSGKPEQITLIGNIIGACFKELTASLNPKIIFDLLMHADPAIQGLAGKLLVLRKLDPEQVPDTIIFTLLQSENTMARDAAIDLLGQLDATAILEKQSLVLSLCLSPVADLRQSAQRLMDKLLAADPSSGYGLVNLFIPVLTVKEKHDGLHEDILQLISTKLQNYLDRIEPKQVLALCTSRYLASQELGYLLLEKNAKPEEISIKDLNKLANSNLLKTRQYVMKYYKTNVARMKYERENSIMLADSLWEDVRTFAFDFFRNHFDEQDWQPELFVALCDSNKTDVQAYGREMITRWFEKDNGFDYLLKLSQHPDSRMQLFASGFLDQYAKNNYDMLQKLGGFLITLLSQVNRGRTAKLRAIQLLHTEALAGEQNAVLISAIFNRMSATASIQDKALYIKAMLEISKAFPSVSLVLGVKETEVYTSKRNDHAVQL